MVGGSACGDCLLCAWELWRAVARSWVQSGALKGPFQFAIGDVTGFEYEVKPLTLEIR
jgi:hypothetical protein